MDAEVKMQARPETLFFLAELEKYSNRKLAFAKEVAQLLDLAWASNKQQVFEDIAFFAKFVTHANSIMKRIGRDGEGYDKLASEFQGSMEKATTLLRTLVKDSPEEIKQPSIKNFLSMDHQSLSQLIKLLEDFSWIKNWMIDGKVLPWQI